nr:hypothetical protein GCM10020185_46400 [Pseudomonas brassicacearum subsp. brassicacearum]
MTCRKNKNKEPSCSISASTPQADAVRRAAQLSQDEYTRLYKESIEHPSAFWAEQATRFLDWMTPWQTVQRYDLKNGDATWFAGGKLNVSANCIDRHLQTRGDQTAIIWEGDDPAESAEITYKKTSQPCVPPGQRAEKAVA